MNSACHNTFDFVLHFSKLSDDTLTLNPTSFTPSSAETEERNHSRRGYFRNFLGDCGIIPSLLVTAC